MTKLLFWLLLAFLVLYVLRTKSRGGQAAPKQRSETHHKPQHRPQGGPAESMLRCARCGVHIPESEVLRAADGTPFCSDEHRHSYAPH